MAEAPKLKDYFTDQVVRSIGERFAAAATGFSVDEYLERALTPAEGEPFSALEFTDRSRRIADAIEETAGLDPVPLIDALVASLPAELDGYEGVLNDGFDLWPYGEIIGRHGADHPSECLAACYELTKRFTAEFAIRPILANHPESLATVQAWTTDPNEHVRRLASEGTRPRLPWAQRLQLPLDEILTVLGDLRSDQSKYVQKSVGNHLNDLAKDHPDRIIGLMADWHREDDPATQWIVRHAMRNHLKDGTPAALAIFGYETPKITIDDLAITPARATIGDTVEASFTLQSAAPKEQKVMVDLVMGYMKANGTTSPKVFKFKDMTLAGSANESFTKRFDMLVRSTRKLYPGTHSLTVRVNGHDLASTTFELAE